MISEEDIQKFNSSTDEDEKFDIVEKYGYTTPAQFRKAIESRKKELSTKSTPQIKKEEEEQAEIDNAPTVTEQKKIESEQEGNKLLGKSVNIGIDDIAEAYAPNNEKVKSLIKISPSNNYGGAMTRLIVGSDSDNKPIYESNKEYVDRNRAAFKSMGLDWSNKNDRALVAKELEKTEVDKSKKDIREGRGSGLDKVIKYGSDIVFPRSVEEVERRLDDPNSTGEFDFPVDLFNKNTLADVAENVVQTVASPVVAPIKAVGRFAPKAAKAVSKVVDANAVTRYVPKLLDNLGDVTESEIMDKIVYNNDPTNERSNFSVGDVILGGGVNTVAPYMLDRQTGRLGRRLDINAQNVVNKRQGNSVTSDQLRARADELEGVFDKAIGIRNAIINDYAKPYGGWENVPGKIKGQANADLFLRIAKAGPEVEDTYRAMYGLDKKDALGITQSVPTSFSDIDQDSFDKLIETPDQLRKKADYVDYLNEGYKPKVVVDKDGKVKRPYKIKKDKNATGVDEKGNIVDIYGMPIDELPPVPMKEALRKDAITYKTKPKSLFSALWLNDLPEIPSNIRNRGVKIKQYEDIPRNESFDPTIGLKVRKNSKEDATFNVARGVYDRGATWLPNKTGKSEMVRSLPVVSDFMPTDEEIEEKNLIESSPTLRVNAEDQPAIVTYKPNLFDAIYNTQEGAPYYLRDPEEDEEFDISFMPSKYKK